VSAQHRNGKGRVRGTQKSHRESSRAPQRAPRDLHFEGSRGTSHACRAKLLRRDADLVGALGGHGSGGGQGHGHGGDLGHVSLERISRGCTNTRKEAVSRARKPWGYSNEKCEGVRESRCF
jgi:hypothetical protein